MKLRNSLILAALTGLGTAAAIDHYTNSKDSELLDPNKDKVEYDYETSYASKNGFKVWVLKDDHTDVNETTLEMPIQDALNLYQCIEDVISIYQGLKKNDATDHEIFGDKAISFERLYDALKEIQFVPVDTESVNEPSNENFEPQYDDPFEGYDDGSNNPEPDYPFSEQVTVDINPDDDEYIVKFEWVCVGGPGLPNTIRTPDDIHIPKWSLENYPGKFYIRPENYSPAHHGTNLCVGDKDHYYWFSGWMEEPMDYFVHYKDPKHYLELNTPIDMVHVNKNITLRGYWYWVKYPKK